MLDLTVVTEYQPLNVTLIGFDSSLFTTLSRVLRSLSASVTLRIV